MPKTARELNLREIFPFELDDFQIAAIAALDSGRSVVVCAPTGSGKTLVGEYAIHRALAAGKRVFYTTPLKALSNQKYRDFRASFGNEQVGLLTGDTSVNRDAPIVVMTTEIFRNMLYGTRIGEVGTSVQDVEAVVLDECHYMNDRQRGTVWEESIIYCPPDIQLVALSATVANSQELTDWISRVHGPTELIYSDYRPVPLQFQFCSPKGMFPLLDKSQKRIHPQLQKSRKPEKGKRQDSPSHGFVLSKLWERDMLPAIYFIFSRRGCDAAVQALHEQTSGDYGDLSLVNPEEAQRLKQRVEEFLARNPEAARAGSVKPLLRGIASHHAGVLPAWKGLIEELFQENLIKVVFATETLAAGINMPARTTVISSLSKRTDQGHRLLTASEFLQMAGRAGRRGMDTVGHVVTVQTPFEGAKEAAYLATNGADPLVSQFTPSYGMVLNLLQTHSLEEAKELVERSFGQYLATLILKPQQQAIADLTTELSHLDYILSKISPSLFGNYEKLSGHLKEERRLLKTLRQQAEEERAEAISQMLTTVQPGTLLSLKGKHVPVPTPLPAVLAHKIEGSGLAPYYVCLGADNRWYVITSVDVVDCEGFPRFPEASQHIPPPEMLLRPGHCRRGGTETTEIARSMAWATRNDGDSYQPELETDTSVEVVAQEQRVHALEEQLKNHPLRQFGDPATLLKRYNRRESIQSDINQRQAKLDQYLGRHWEEFLDLIAILQDMGGLDQFRPTPLGEAAAVIRGENELWLAIALLSGHLDELDPHHLAAVCAALVTETPRPDTWANYRQGQEVDLTLMALQESKRQLIKRQYQQDVALPVWPENKLLKTGVLGLVEQWALGTSWADLCNNTSLDEGDIVRLLRRTVDLLSQIPYVPYISEPLMQNTYRAIHLLDRFPVNEEVK